MADHDHEDWQLLDHPDGGKYCGACGQDAPPRRCRCGLEFPAKNLLFRHIHAVTENFTNTERHDHGPTEA